MQCSLVSICTCLCTCLSLSMSNDVRPTGPTLPARHFPRFWLRTVFLCRMIFVQPVERILRSVLPVSWLKHVRKLFLAASASCHDTAILRQSALVHLILASVMPRFHMDKRPLMVLFKMIYNLCYFGTASAARHVNVIEHLSRSEAQKLQLAAILAPMATAGLRSQVSPVVAALDASPSARANVETLIGKDLASALWRHSKRKGTFSRHETQARTLLREKKALECLRRSRLFFSDTGPGTLTPRGPDAFVYDAFDLPFGQYTNPRGLLAEWSYGLTPIRGLE